MKRNSKFALLNKAILVICIIGLVFSAVACTKSQDTSGTTTAEVTLAQTEASQPKPLYTVQVLANMAINPNIRTSEENDIGKVFKEKFNIVFEYIPYTGDFVEKANLMLATGDYPDIITLNSADMIRKYIEAGAAVDLEQYFNICPNFPEVFKVQIPFWRTYSSKEGIYHWENGSTAGLSGDLSLTPKVMPQDIAVRSDALAKQNWPNIVKEDNLVAFLKQAIKDFPESDGKKTVGMTAPFAEPWGLQGIVPIAFEKGEKYTAAAGNNDVIFNVQDGKFEDYFLNEYVFESFRFFNRLYREGLLDTECFTDKYPQTVDKMKSGKALSSWYAVWPLTEANAAFDAAGKPDMKYITVPFQTNTQYDKDEKRLNVISSTNSGAAYMITNKAKDPARIMEFLNWLMTEEGQVLLQSGVEGKTYVMKDGKREPTEQYLKDYSGPSSPLKIEVGLALEYRWLPYVLGLASDGLPYDLDTPELQEKLLTARQKECNEKLGLSSFYDKLYFKPIDFVTSCAPDPQSDLGKMTPKLVDFRNKAAATLILAKTEEQFNQIYNTAVEDYKKMQPEKVVEEYNRLYQEKIKSIK